MFQTDMDAVLSMEPYQKNLLHYLPTVCARVGSVYVGHIESSKLGAHSVVLGFRACCRELRLYFL